MKKVLYSLATVAALLLAAACEREVSVTAGPEDLVEATFNIAMPGNVATKTISDGTQATELLFFAFDGNGKYLENVKPATYPVSVSGYNAAVTVKLIKGMTYNFVFWAQKPGQYTNLITVTNGTAGASLDISTVAANMMNNDDFDAFYGRIANYKVEKAFSTETLYLTRPFAQVNVGAEADDIDAAHNSNIVTDNPTLKTKYYDVNAGTLNVNTTLNLLTGEAGGATGIDFTLASRPDQSLTVDGKDYDWLAMLYLLQTAPDYYDSDLEFVNADEAKTTLAELDFNISTTQNGDAVNTDRTVYNVPVQRNYRTNILGNIFSVDGTFNITVDQNFLKVNDGSEDYLPEYENIAALNEAFAKADAADADKWSYKVKVLAPGSDTKIVLPNTTDPVDIVFADDAWTGTDLIVEYAAADAAKPTKLTITVDDLQSLTANLPQTTIVYTEGTIQTATITSAPHTFVIEEDATVTNLTILGGGLTVEGTVGEGTVAEGLGDITTTIAATATVGKLTIESGDVVVDKDSNIETAVNVRGGGTVTVDQNDDDLGDIHVDVTVTVQDEEGNTVEENLGDALPAKMNTKEALAAALASEDETISITLEGDIPDADGIFLAASNPKNLTIDLGGYTLGVARAVGSTGTVSQALHLEKGSTVVIKNGTIIGSPLDGILMLVQNYADLTLDSVILDFTESGRSYALSNNFGHVTITGDTQINVAEGKTAFDLWYGMSASYADGVYVTFDDNFTGEVNGNIEYGAGSYGKNVENWQEKAVLTIKGNGTFNGNIVASSTGALEGASINIYSGTFSSDPSAFAVTGYTGEQQTDGTWKIVEKTQKAPEFSVAYTEPTEALQAGDELVVTVTTNSDGEISYAVDPGDAASVVADTEGKYKITAAQLTKQTSVKVTFSVTETDDYTAATKDVTFDVAEYVEPIVYTTIAQLKALLTTTSQEFEYELNTFVVSGVSGSSAFIEDNTGGMVVYKSSHGLTAGKSISGFIAKKGVLYSNNLPEITDFAVTGATITDVDLPLAEKGIAEINDNFSVLVGQRVKLTGVTFPDVTGNSKAQTITVTQDESSIKVYAKITENIVAGSVGNIIGNVTYYSNNNQITVTEDNAIEITQAVLPTAVISGMPATLTTLKAGDEYTFNAAVNNVSGATVTYAITNGSDYADLDLDGNKVTIKSGAAAGSVIKVTASAAAIENVCYAAEDVVCTITVAETPQGGGDDPEYVEQVVYTTSFDYSISCEGDIY